MRYAAYAAWLWRAYPSLAWGLPLATLAPALDRMKGRRKPAGR